MQRPDKLDPSVIDRAPDNVDGKIKQTRQELIVEVRRLRNENVVLSDDLERARAEVSVETQKARLLIPYSNKVFVYLCWFTGGVGLLIFLHGDSSNSFSLPTSVLDLLAGSSLASVVGLVGTILVGLFKSN